jgi:hypothetical protein
MKRSLWIAFIIWRLMILDTLAASIPRPTSNLEMILSLKNLIESNPIVIG